MSFGVDSSGFTPKPVTTILTEIEASEHADIDAALDVSPAQPIGQINGVVAAADGTAWELAQAVYNAMDPDKAEGIALDNLCSLTGTYRRAANKTKVTVTLTATGVCVVPAGHILSVVGHPDQTFTLDTTHNFGGAGTFDALYSSTVAGPLVVQTGTLTNIVTPIANLASASNAAGSGLTTGLAIETDTELRKKRILELQGSGNGNPDAIRSDLLKVAGVVEALCLENPTDFYVGVLPPHSLRAIVWDGAAPVALDLDIGNVLWRNRSAGIYAYGATAVTVKDALNNDQVLHFDRATQKLFYCDITLTKTADYAGDTAVKQAIVDLVNSSATRRLGRDVVHLSVQAAPMGVLGVTDVTICEMDFVVTPAATANLAVGDTELAIADVSRITVAYA